MGGGLSAPDIGFGEKDFYDDDAPPILYEDVDRTLLKSWLVECGLDPMRAREVSHGLYDRGICSEQQLIRLYCEDSGIIDYFISKELLSAREASRVCSSASFVSSIERALEGNEEGRNNSNYYAALRSSRQHGAAQAAQRASLSRAKAQQDRQQQVREAETHAEMMFLLESALSAASSEFDYQNGNHGRYEEYENRLEDSCAALRQLLRSVDRSDSDCGDGDGDGDGDGGYLREDRKRRAGGASRGSSGPRDGGVVRGLIEADGVSSWDEELSSFVVQLHHDGAAASVSYEHAVATGGRGFDILGAAVSRLTGNRCYLSVRLTTMPLGNNDGGSGAAASARVVSTLGSMAALSASPSFSFGMSLVRDFSECQSVEIPCFGQSAPSWGLVLSPRGFCSVVENNLCVEKTRTLEVGDVLAMEIDFDFEVAHLMVNGVSQWTFTGVAGGCERFMCGVTLPAGFAVRLLSSDAQPRSENSFATHHLQSPTHSSEEAMTASASSVRRGSTAAAAAAAEIERRETTNELSSSHSSSTSGQYREPEALAIPVPVPVPAPVPAPAPAPLISAAALRRMEQNKASRQQAIRDAHSSSSGASSSGSSSRSGVVSVMNGSRGVVNASLASRMGSQSNREMASAHVGAAANGLLGSASEKSGMPAAAAAAAAAAAGNFETGQASGGAAGAGDESSLCCVCIERAKCVVLMPCRHMCLCAECGEGAEKTLKACPICRENIAFSLRVFT